MGWYLDFLKKQFAFLNFCPHSIWCIDCAVWLLPLHSSHQDVSVRFLVSVTLQLNTTQFLPILLVHPLVLLLTPSSVLFGNDFLFFARPLAFFFNLFFLFQQNIAQGNSILKLFSQILWGRQDDVLGQGIHCFVFWQVGGDYSRPAVFPVALSTVLVLAQFLSLRPSTKNKNSGHVSSISKTKIGSNTRILFLNFIHHVVLYQSSQEFTVLLHLSRWVFCCV